jgi:glycosyltransferase involved in cell wall biosynthesis
MKIAMIGQRSIPADYGGINTYVEELSQRLVDKGHEVTVFCRREYSGSKDENYKGVKLKYFPYIPTKHLETLSHSLLSSLYAVFNNYDIVHYHGLGSAIFSILPKIFWKKSVLTIQGLDWKAEKWGFPAKLFLKLCGRVSTGFPNRTVVVSKALYEYYSRKYKTEVYYIPNGANTASSQSAIENPELKDKGYLLYLGRFAPQKGIHYLIQAFKKINTDKRLVIAGGSSYTDKYIRHLRNLARPDRRIIFTGPLYGLQKEKVLSQAYLFILPSEIEGLSLALLEAMGHRRCCLVSDIPENLEAIDDSGFSFRAKDAADLKEKLEFLLSKPDLVEKTGQRSQARIQECYNWERISDEIEKLYIEAMS